MQIVSWVSRVYSTLLRSSQNISCNLLWTQPWLCFMFFWVLECSELSACHQRWETTVFGDEISSAWSSRFWCLKPIEKCNAPLTSDFSWLSPDSAQTQFKYSLGQLPLCLFLEETNLVYGKMSWLGTLTISEYVCGILVGHFQSIIVQSMIRM